MNCQEHNVYWYGSTQIVVRCDQPMGHDPAEIHHDDKYGPWAAIRGLFERHEEIPEDWWTEK